MTEAGPRVTDTITDTIYALSTPPGRGGIAVLRLSGPAARAALEALGGPTDPEPRKAILADFADPADGAAIDHGLAIWFPGPGSFSGEDMAELHLHGGPAVVAAALTALARLDGLRPAEPGEFTRRAFDSGKLDLSELEGLADLIAAETEAQRRQALAQMGGALSRHTESWRSRLLRALAHLEAMIDFPDEDLPPGIAEEVRREASQLRDEIGDYLGSQSHGERLRSGFQIAIVGAPNVGKSSLLNAIARRDVAIVSETAGTTRDLIEVHLDLGGYPAVLVDTAGLREAAGAADPVGDVEAEGMRRARGRAEAADLNLVVADVQDWRDRSDRPPPSPDLDALIDGLMDGRAILVLNKADLAPEISAESHRGRPVFVVSAREETGLGPLMDHLTAHVVERLGVSGSAPSLTRLRHRESLEDCRAALGRALDAEDAALGAEDLRLAARALGRITGRIDVEDVLDLVFKEFCIGK